MISRRLLLKGTLAGSALLARAAMAGDTAEDMKRKIADLERKRGGRLGVAILDTARAAPVAFRGDERFALCSTFKLLAVGLVLARVDRGLEDLSRRVVYERDCLLPYSPVTQAHAGEGLTVGALCEAAITLSDNTAANLLLGSFGGPGELTAYLRTLNDDVTRLDRREPDLNRVAPGDLRDTTTPLAMLEAMRKLLVGTALSVSSRQQLIAWLVANKTGDKRLRAGLPAGWRIGDKTGTGPNGEANDIAILWPPGHAPLIVTAYYVNPHASDEERDAVLSQIGRLVSRL